MKSHKPWDCSVSTLDIAKEGRMRLRRFDASRRISPSALVEYLPPPDLTSKAYQSILERNSHYSDLRKNIESSIRQEDPTISPEHLRGKLFRLFNQQVDRIEKGVCERPLSRLLTRPVISITCKSRRYKEWFHTGIFGPHGDRDGFWSCCSSLDKNSRGCEYRIIDPDAWCVFP